MEIIIYGTRAEAQGLKDLLDTHEEFVYRQKSYTHHDSYDDFIASLESKRTDIVFVLDNGAMGMECVIASRNISPNTPVVWFSSDKDFAIQSYRIGAQYFGAKPITHEQISSAMSRIVI